MTLIDRMESQFAYDSGCVSSGINDPIFKQELKDRKHGDLMPMLTKLALGLLSEPEYTLEDIKSIIDWAKNELDYDI